MLTIRGLADIVANGWAAGKLVLMADTFLPDRQDNVATDFTEYSGPGYTGGHNGASRKTLASLAVNEDDANQRAELDAADPSAWTGLTGPAAVGTMIGVIRQVTADSDTVIRGYVPIKSRSLAITAATAANPAVLTAAAHGLANGQVVYLDGIAGGTWAANVNKRWFVVGNVTTNTFELTGINSTGFGTATFASALVYRPTPMNGADFQPQFDAEGLFQIAAIDGE